MADLLRNEPLWVSKGLAKLPDSVERFGGKALGALTNTGTPTSRDQLAALLGGVAQAVSPKGSTASKLGNLGSSMATKNATTRVQKALQKNKEDGVDLFTGINQTDLTLSDLSQIQSTVQMLFGQGMEEKKFGLEEKATTQQISASKTGEDQTKEQTGLLKKEGELLGVEVAQAKNDWVFDENTLMMRNKNTGEFKHVQGEDPFERMLNMQTRMKSSINSLTVGLQTNKDVVQQELRVLRMTELPKMITDAVTKTMYAHDSLRGEPLDEGALWGSIGKKMSLEWDIQAAEAIGDTATGLKLRTQLEALNENTGKDGYQDDPNLSSEENKKAAAKWRIWNNGR